MTETHRPLTLLLALLLASAWTQAETAPAAPNIRTLNSGNLVLDGIPEWSPQIASDLNRFQNVRSAPVRDWTHDGRSLYVATRFADVAQIHRVDQPGGARHQLTFFPEPVGSWSRSPVDDAIVFSMDRGGSEFSQLYRYDPATGDSVLLTDGKSRNGGTVWSDDGRLIAFSSTRRDGASNDVWVMQPNDPASARLAFPASDGTAWGALTFTPDGQRLFLQNYTSITRSAVGLLDLASGELSWVLGGPDEPGRRLGALLAADGRGLFYGTDAGSDFLRLAHRTQFDDPSTEQVLTSNINWDVTDFTLSPDKTRGAFAVNEDGLNRLYLLDPATLRHRVVDGLPVGLIGGLQFSPDGTRLALTLNTARTPSDTFVLALNDDRLRAGELTRWTYSEVGGLDTSRFIEPELIHYPTFDEVDGAPRKIPSFYYRPAGPGPHPVIISIHGGPEAQAQPAFSSTYQLWMHQLGAAVLVPNVRGSDGYGSTYLGLDNGYQREDSVRDIGALLDWIATQPELDASRVAVIGGSYGGYMVLASAVHYGERLRAAVDIVGISNFVTFLENTESYRRDLRRVEYGDERDPDMRAFLERISPLNNVDRIITPLFVVQGQNDPRVPVTEADQIVRALRERNRTVWYMNALNEGHGFRRKENRDLYEQAVVAFFQEHLVR